MALRSAHRARARGASRAAQMSVASGVLTRAAVQRGSRDNITVVVVDLRRGGFGGGCGGTGAAGDGACVGAACGGGCSADGGAGDDDAAPSLAAVLAAQCSEEVALAPRRSAARRGSRAGDGGGNGAGGAAAGAGVGGWLTGAAGSWLSGLLSRSSLGALVAGSFGTRGGGGAPGCSPATDDACVFRAPGLGAARRRAGAAAVTPVGVSVAPLATGAPLPPPEAAAAGGDGCAPTGRAGPPPKVVGGAIQRSLSFSSVELGRVLRRARLESDAGGAAPAAAAQ